MILDFRKSVIVAALILYTFYTWAQDSLPERKHRKFEAGLSYTLAGPGTFTNPIIGYGSDRHSVHLGCLFRPFYGGSFGITSDYKFFPNQRKNRANLYFTLNVLFIRRSSSIIIRDYSLEAILGYGFELRLVSEFYLTSDLGFGIHQRWNNYNYVYEDKSTLAGVFRIGLLKRFRKKSN